MVLTGQAVELELVRVKFLLKLCTLLNEVLEGVFVLLGQQLLLVQLLLY